MKFCNKKFWEFVYFTAGLINKYIIQPTIAAIKWTWKTIVATVKFCNKKFWEFVYFTAGLINKYVASDALFEWK